jgi:subtilisin family serine protease
MMPSPLQTSLLQLPEYHEDMLLVKMRPAAATFAATAAFASMGTLGASPGVSALAFYERAGLIKRVTPLRRPGGAAHASPARSLLATLGASVVFPPQREARVSDGVSIVELQKGTDLAHLQMALASDMYVEFVSRVPIRYLLARPRHTDRTPQPPADGGATIAAVPPPANTMWNLLKIKWREARTAGLTAADQISVAVLDTGVDLNHPDLPGADITYVHDYPESGASAPEADVVGHGTHVSGTIRAIIDNNLGINGICDCKLSLYKIFDDQLFNTGQYFAYGVNPILYRAALAACVDAGVQVVNLSIGGYGTPDPVESGLFQALINNNVAVVAAMGNDNTSQLSYPAAIPGVIAVGATSLDDTRASFSNFGSHIALSAPGVTIWSTLPTYPGQTGFYYAGAGNLTVGQPMARETNYAAWNGTSMATPHVTAAAALALQKNGVLSPADLKKLLMRAAEKVPDMNGEDFTPNFGAGRLNLLNLVS